MAVDARSSTVGAKQRELRLRVVEAGQFLPGLGRMAGFTTGPLPIGPELFHAFFELTVVNIFVAAGTVEIFPVIDGGRLGLKVFRFLVAVGARHGYVTTSQPEMRLSVFG